MPRKPSAKAGQVHPKGGMITIDEDERARIKAAREEAGLTQSEIAVKVGVTAATISNLETGRHPQVRKTVYAKILRVLKLAKAAPDASPANDETYKALVDEVIDLDGGEQALVIAYVKHLKKSR